VLTFHIRGTRCAGARKLGKHDAHRAGISARAPGIPGRVPEVHGAGRGRRAETGE